MNNSERDLLEYVCAGNLKKARQQAKIIVEKINTATDKDFKQRRLEELAKAEQHLIELPYNMQGLLAATDVSKFPEHRFVLRPDEAAVVDDILAIREVAHKLAELGIAYSPSLLLYGVSGGGKTMLAKYIAYKADLPFVYVRFSGLIESHLGATSNNVARIFDFARSNPCVLCFDELDAVAMARNTQHDHAEMSRVVIAIMQELDNMPNDNIIIAATNRFKDIDPAVVRRFSKRHEVKLLDSASVAQLAKRFFAAAGIATNGWLPAWLVANFDDVGQPASKVIECCTEQVIAELKGNVGLFEGK